MSTFYPCWRGDLLRALGAGLWSNGRVFSGRCLGFDCTGVSSPQAKRKFRNTKAAAYSGQSDLRQGAEKASSPDDAVKAPEYLRLQSCMEVEGRASEATEVKISEVYSTALAPPAPLLMRENRLWSRVAKGITVTLDSRAVDASAVIARIAMNEPCVRIPMSQLDSMPSRVYLVSRSSHAWSVLSGDISALHKNLLKNCRSVVEARLLGNIEGRASFGRSGARVTLAQHMHSAMGDCAIVCCRRRSE